MKRFIIAVLISSIAFGVSQSGSFKFGLNLDLSDFSVSNYQDLWMNYSAAELDLSANLSVNFSRLDSFELNISKGGLRVSLYKNRTFPNTSDLLGLYRFDYGQDGFKIDIWKIDLVFLTSNFLNYSAIGWNGFSALLGVREGGYDLAFSFNRTDFPIFGEYIIGLPNSGSFYLIGLKSSDWRYGLKYYGGDMDLPPFTSIDTGRSGVFEIWAKPDRFNIWANVDTKSLTASSIGLGYTGDGWWLNIWKGNLDKLGLDPLKLGNFGIELGGNFALAGFNIKASYSFGSPAHQTVQTIGEVYKVELSRGFGNTSFFAKVQYIVGYYERRFTAYAEVKFGGFKNSELKISIGNGDFDNVNTFQGIVNLELNTWW